MKTTRAVGSTVAGTWNEKNFPVKAQQEMPEAAVVLARENPVLSVLSFVALSSLLLLWLYSWRD